MTIDHATALKKLESIGQQHLLQFWDALSEKQKEHLLNDIASLDVTTFRKQQDLVVHPPVFTAPIEPITNFTYAGSPEDRDRGFKLLKQGKVGCIVLAGGQGTRLHFNGPKGMFPVSAVRNASLYQLLAEKTVAASKQANQLLHLAFMTSPLNDQATRTYFEEHRHFGLANEQIHFFTQSMLPFLTGDGNLFLEAPDTLAKGPDGNGNILHDFYHSGLWTHWKKAGIEAVNVVLIDNPLADPFDAELVAYHQRTGAQATFKSILRSDPVEKIGVIVKSGPKTVVREYSEISKEEQTAVNPDGSLKHRCASLSLFCFSMDFIAEVAEHCTLPLHKAFKAASAVDDQGLTQMSAQPNAWKFEKFIFDVIPFADQVEIIVYPRQECFAPLKNHSGDASPQTVKNALMQRDREIFSGITGNPPTQQPIELAAEFYYPTPELLTKWKGRSLPSTPYVEP
jgi:UDP-N-acetylglucosamine/UDP-N-acetylgalactosamine diphosphorylase